MDTFITVRIGQLPGVIQEIALNGDRSVDSAVEAAGLDPEGYEIRVDGRAADLDTELEDRQTVLLVKKVKGNQDFITVRVGQLPGVIQEITLNGGRTVEDALDAAELDHEGYEIRVNGSPADLCDPLTDGQTVLLVKKIKGNRDFITVRIGQLPGVIQEIALNGDRSVDSAVEAAGLDPEGYEIRVDGRAADLDTELEDRQTVLLVKKVKGNC